AAELEYLKRELAVREQAHEDHVALQQRHTTLENEFLALKKQLNDAVTARDRAVAELTEHRESITRQQAEVERERARKDELLARMRALLNQIEARRKQADEERDSTAHLLEEVEQLAVERMPLIVQAGGDDATLDKLLEEATQVWRQRCEQYEQAAHVTQERATEAAAECMRLQAAMEQQASQIRDLQQTISSLTTQKKRL